MVSRRFYGSQPHFMVLSDSNYTCNFTYNGTTIESSKEEKVLGITIDDKLTFTSHLASIIKKANQKFHALSRVKCYMGLEQNQLIMSPFIKSQFNYCPLIWMFCSRTSMNKLNNIYEKCLRIITDDYNSNINELLQSSHELLNPKTWINYLMIEVYELKSLQHSQYSFIWLWKSTDSAFWSGCSSVSWLSTMAEGTHSNKRFFITRNFHGKNKFTELRRLQV